MRKRSFVLTVLGFAGMAAGAPPEKNHVGPVTGLIEPATAAWSCSQAGVFRGLYERMVLVRRPQWRTIDLAMRVDTEGVPVDGDLIICGGEPGVSGIVARWRPAKSDWDEIVVGKDLAYAVAVSADAAFLAMADGRVLEVPRDRFEAKAVIERHRHSAAARAVAITPDQRHLVSVGMDRVVLISRLGENSEPIAVQDHTDRIDALVLSDDGKCIASGARDGKVRLHDLNGKLIRTYPILPGMITALAWCGSADDGTLVAGTSKGHVYDLDPTKNTVTERIRLKSPIASLALGADSALLIGEDHRFHITEP